MRESWKTEWHQYYGISQDLKTDNEIPIGIVLIQNLPLLSCIDLYIVQKVWCFLGVLVSVVWSKTEQSAIVWRCMQLTTPKYMWALKIMLLSRKSEKESSKLNAQPTCRGYHITSNKRPGRLLNFLILSQGWTCIRMKLHDLASFYISTTWNRSFSFD